MCLTHLQELQKAVVTAVSGNQELLKRLASMGLCSGTTVRMLQARKKGPLLVECKGTYLALSYDIASRIRLEPAQAVL
ncbi:FeoA family protein [Oleidesulfovibrio alaskensis]|jgi:Fe2+ transport system protein FeoA|uniref:FeoA family protein n=1 Tax=Oleidesulfovibrio alaskensis TaxID=58180 RepID=UPI001A4AFEE7|nr:FeoA family protein [Oleidesulfovibrio alaskensis]MBL3582311.1 ferrous iron transport protein A [Oleidesulfovibrio alaskensis]